MITIDGYSNEPAYEAEGICITMGAEMIIDKGGLLRFIRWFEQCLHDEDGWFYHKCKNGPSVDVLYVYIIIANRLYYRCSFASHSRQPVEAFLKPGSEESVMIDWPHLILTGPLIRCPYKRKLSGFRSFRYCKKLF